MQEMNLDKVLLKLIKSSIIEIPEHFEDVLNHMMKSLSSTMLADRASVWLYNEQKSAIICQSLYLVKTNDIEKGVTLLRSDFESYFKALEEERIIEAANARENEATKCFSESYLAPLGIESMFDAPIWSGGKIIGVLCLEYFSYKKEWSREEKYFITSISDLIGNVIERKNSLELVNFYNKQRTAIDRHNLVSITDLSGRITYCNEKFCEVSQYKKEELIGKTHQVVNSGTHPSEFWKEMWSTIQSGKTWSGEICNRAKDGSLYWVDATITALRDSSGNIKEYIALRTDITQQVEQQKFIKKRFQEAEAVNKLLKIDHGLEISLSDKLSSALKTILHVSWVNVANKGGIFLVENEKLNLTVSENLGTHIENLCQKVDPGHCLCGRAFVEKKTVYAGDIDDRHETLFEGIHPHGHYNVPILEKKNVLGVMVFYLPSGHPRNDAEIEFLESCADVLSQIISNHRKEEEIVKARDLALVAKKAKSEFLANMSHEIRTPMNGVLGMTELLKNTKLTKQQCEMLDIIRSCGDSLLVILNDILDLSKIESGKLELEPINFNLENCIDEGIKLLSFAAKEKEIVVVKEFDKNVSHWFHGDVTRVRQIIVNFLSNAIKFTSHGEVTISLHLIEDHEKSAKIKLSVKDTGIGIAKESIDKLFQAFTQADNSVTRQFGGTGLGLSICSKLASLMGGEITLESEKGVGSTFSFIVELQYGNEEAVGQKVHHLKKTKSFREEQKILLVEDNKVNQRLAQMVLDRLGHNCDVADNGQEAINKLIENGVDHYSLILMDMQMPIMDGITATYQILKDFKNPPPIIAMTANVFEEDKQRCFEAGMVDFVAKPVSIPVLKDILNKFAKVA